MEVAQSCGLIMAIQSLKAIQRKGKRMKLTSVSVGILEDFPQISQIRQRRLQAGIKKQSYKFDAPISKTYYLLPITYYLLPITYYPLPITSYLLSILNSSLSYANSTPSGNSVITSACRPSWWEIWVKYALGTFSSWTRSMASPRLK